MPVVRVEALEDLDLVSVFELGATDAALEFAAVCVLHAGLVEHVRDYLVDHPLRQPFLRVLSPLLFQVQAEHVNLLRRLLFVLPLDRIEDHLLHPQIFF